MEKIKKGDFKVGDWVYWYGEATDTEVVFQCGYVNESGAPGRSKENGVFYSGELHPLTPLRPGEAKVGDRVAVLAQNLIPDGPRQGTIVEVLRDLYGIIDVRGNHIDHSGWPSESFARLPDCAQNKKEDKLYAEAKANTLGSYDEIEQTFTPFDLVWNTEEKKVFRIIGQGNTPCNVNAWDSGDNEWYLNKKECVKLEPLTINVINACPESSMIKVIALQDSGGADGVELGKEYLLVYLSSLNAFVSPNDKDTRIDYRVFALHPEQETSNHKLSIKEYFVSPNEFIANPDSDNSYLYIPTNADLDAWVNRHPYFSDPKPQVYNPQHIGIWDYLGEGYKVTWDEANSRYEAASIKGYSYMPEWEPGEFWKQIESWGDGDPKEKPLKSDTRKKFNDWDPYGGFYD